MDKWPEDYECDGQISMFDGKGVNKVNEVEIKDKVLKCICEHDALIDGYPKVFPCTCISKYINESVYKVRKCMKELESDGYVKKSSEGGLDYWSCKIYCIHGYSLTEKGHNHKYYKDALEKEIEWWNKQNKKEEVEK